MLHCKLAKSMPEAQNHNAAAQRSLVWELVWKQGWGQRSKTKNSEHPTWSLVRRMHQRHQRWEVTYHTLHTLLLHWPAQTLCVWMHVQYVRVAAVSEKSEETFFTSQSTTVQTTDKNIPATINQSSKCLLRRIPLISDHYSAQQALSTPNSITWAQRLKIRFDTCADAVPRFPEPPQLQSCTLAEEWTPRRSKNKPQRRIPFLVT